MKTKTTLHADGNADSVRDVASQRFITDYLDALKERTRAENLGIAYGLDWVIYNLGLALGWQPVRLPFLRDSQALAAKTKTEREFGIDLSFFADNGATLKIFVVKDEVLTYRNWIVNDFDSDLRRASAPDFTRSEFSNVTQVIVVLAYNKDEDDGGVSSYERLVKTFPKTIGDGVSLTFERWNLSKLSEYVQAHLLTPELLPQNLSGLLSYICSQVADFEYGSEAWDRQLIPNWRRFLCELDKGRDVDAVLQIIPVVLVILERFKRTTPDAIIGWLDLMEWSMLRLWEKFPNLAEEKQKNRVISIWSEFFVERYCLFLEEQAPILQAEHAVQTHHYGLLMPLDAVNDSCAMYWLLERIGIFFFSCVEIFHDDKQVGQESLLAIIQRVHQWISSAINFQPAIFRPLLDLHHIAIFFVWYILFHAQDSHTLNHFLGELARRLFVRRVKSTLFPFIEGGNQLELVGEAVATCKIPPEFVDGTSYLVLMLIELCFSLPEKERDELLCVLYNQVVEGKFSDGQKGDMVKFLHLQDWIPPKDWSVRIFRESVCDGTEIPDPFFDFEKELSVDERVKRYVTEIQEKYPSPKFNVPSSAIILACVKHRSPLPAFFWRDILFPKSTLSNVPNVERDSGEVP